MIPFYNEEVWQRYCQKIEEDFEVKTYPHLDPYFDFVKNKDVLKRIVSDATARKVKEHPFIPFIKILQKTPRYKWQENEQLEIGGEYDLETKIRPICFASHFDTYLYSFYSFVLNNYYQDYIKDRGFAEVVFAYRTDLNGKCNIQFSKEVFDSIKTKLKEDGECSAICLDIKGYFDHIDHAVLKKMWCKVLGTSELPPDHYSLFRSLTKYSYINLSSFQKHFNIDFKKIKKELGRRNSSKNKRGKPYQFLLDLIPDNLVGGSFGEKMELLRRRKLVSVNSIVDKISKKRVLKKCGIPQGSSISALLSNIYLTDFDQQIFEQGQKEQFVYRRYCDDLILICKPGDVNRLKSQLMATIDQKYKLTIQDKKTEVIDFKPSRKGNIRAFKRHFNQESKCFEELPNDDTNFRNLQYLGFEFNGQNIYIRPGSLSRYYRKLKARLVKTVTMAYSKNSTKETINKHQIYSRYTHIGKRNFLSYAYNASKKYYVNSKGIRKEGMDSPSIKRQIAAHFTILKQELRKTTEQIAKQKKATRVKL